MLKVALIEDNTRYRDLLRSMITATGEVEIVFEADRCKDSAAIIAAKPDVVILDIDLPGRSGIDGAADLKRISPELRILMLTVFEDEEKIFAAIKAGADGYLLKKDPPQKILDSIAELHEGKSSMNGLVARKVLEYFQSKPVANVPDEYNLTKREHEILDRLMSGTSYKMIASDCAITLHTLNSHIKNIYKKLGIHTRAEASAKFGARHPIS